MSVPRLFSLIILFTLSHNVWAEPLTFSSGKIRVNLLELYTSEGCSSCPPADKWFRRLVKNPDLWNNIVPVVFHVDYWDYLGWKDKFARPEFASRQEIYSRKGYVSSVYTPGVMLNGRGWRGWRVMKNAPVKNDKTPGKLKATLENNALNVSFSPETIVTDDLVLNVALLSGNIKNKIKAGENHGETLAHDFIVVKHIKKSSTDNANWQLKNLITEKLNYSPYAIAIWLDKKNDPTPIQATGRWLN